MQEFQIIFKGIIKIELADKLAAHESPEKKDIKNIKTLRQEQKKEPPQ